MSRSTSRSSSRIATNPEARVAAAGQVRSPWQPASARRRERGADQRRGASRLCINEAVVSTIAADVVNPTGSVSLQADELEAVWED